MRKQTVQAFLHFRATDERDRGACLRVHTCVYKPLSFGLGCRRRVGWRGRGLVVVDVANGSASIRDVMIHLIIHPPNLPTSRLNKQPSGPPCWTRASP